MAPVIGGRYDRNNYILARVRRYIHWLLPEVLLPPPAFVRAMMRIALSHLTRANGPLLPSVRGKRSVTSGSLSIMLSNQRSATRPGAPPDPESCSSGPPTPRTLATRGNRPPSTAPNFSCSWEPQAEHPTAGEGADRYSPGGNARRHRALGDDP